MKTRKLGSEGLEVSALGLGCMGMSEFYGTSDEQSATATIHRALDLGVTLLDTGHFALETDGDAIAEEIRRVF